MAAAPEPGRGLFLLNGSSTTNQKAGGSIPGLHAKVSLGRNQWRASSVLKKIMGLTDNHCAGTDSLKQLQSKFF